MVMVAGQAPLGIIGATHVSNAITAGGDLKMILGLTSRLNYLLVAGPSIKNAEELKGKKVGIGTPAGPPAIAAYLALEHFGLHPQRDKIVFLQIGGVPQRLAALRAGSIDATTLSPELAQVITGQDYTVLLDIGKENIPFYTAGLVISERLLKSNPQLPENAAKAVIEAVAYIHNHSNKKTVLQTLAAHLRLDKPEQLEKSYQDLLVELPRKPCPTTQGVASGLRLMAQQGINPKAALLKPEDVLETNLCRKLDESGFIDGLYRG
jgi:ABC-type nitrate/sulfonate/bicarbonate transport system substrate-binding protein